MLMVQSSVASLVRRSPDADPREIVTILNKTLHENIRRRLGLADFVTLSLFRYFPDGRVLVAGAHEDIVVWRAATRKCEYIRTTGTWLGAMADVDPHTPNLEYRLSVGDVVLLYTDGITEARSASGEQFGLERLERVLEDAHDQPVQAICDRVLAAVSQWGARSDDQAVVALRYHGA